MSQSTHTHGCITHIMIPVLFYATWNSDYRYIRSTKTLNPNPWTSMVLYSITHAMSLGTHTLTHYSWYPHTDTLLLVPTHWYITLGTHTLIHYSWYPHTDTMSHNTRFFLRTNHLLLYDAPLHPVFCKGGGIRTKVWRCSYCVTFEYEYVPNPSSLPECNIHPTHFPSVTTTCCYPIVILNAPKWNQNRNTSLSGCIWIGIASRSGRIYQLCVLCVPWKTFV
jgi:hypothetical protein